MPPSGHALDAPVHDLAEGGNGPAIRRGARAVLDAGGVAADAVLLRDPVPVVPDRLDHARDDEGVRIEVVVEGELVRAGAGADVPDHVPRRHGPCVLPVVQLVLDRLQEARVLGSAEVPQRSRVVAAVADPHQAVAGSEPRAGPVHVEHAVAGVLGLGLRVVAVVGQVVQQDHLPARPEADDRLPHQPRVVLVEGQVVAVAIGNARDRELVRQHGGAERGKADVVSLAVDPGVRAAQVAAIGDGVAHGVAEGLHGEAVGLVHLRIGGRVAQGLHLVPLRHVAGPARVERCREVDHVVATRDLLPRDRVGPGDRGVGDPPDEQVAVLHHHGLEHLDEGEVDRAGLGRAELHGADAGARGLRGSRRRR